MTAETKSITKLSLSLSEYLDDKQLEQVKKAFFMPLMLTQGNLDLAEILMCLIRLQLQRY